MGRTGWNVCQTLAAEMERRASKWCDALMAERAVELAKAAASASRGRLDRQCATPWVAWDPANSSAYEQIRTAQNMLNDITRIGDKISYLGNRPAIWSKN